MNHATGQGSGLLDGIKNECYAYYMATYRDFIQHARNVTAGRRLSTKVILRILAKSVNLSVGQLVSWALDQPDFNYSLHDRSLLLQPSDMGMAAAIKNRDSTIEIALRRYAEIWPVSYISVICHTSPWWIEAGLVAYSIKRPSVHPRALPLTPGEIDFRKASKSDKMLMVAKATTGMQAPTLEKIGIALGIPAHRVAQYAEDIDLYRSDLIPTITKDRIRQANQRRTRRTNLDEFHRVGVLRDFNNCGSVRAYAASAGISYQTAHKRAIRVGFQGINKKDLAKVDRAGIIQRHREENPGALLSTEQWAEITESTDIWSARQLWYVREALKAHGLQHRDIGRNYWVWATPDRIVTAEDAAVVVQSRMQKSLDLGRFPLDRRTNATIRST